MSRHAEQRNKKQIVVVDLPEDEDTAQDVNEDEEYVSEKKDDAVTITVPCRKIFD